MLWNKWFASKALPQPKVLKIPSLIQRIKLDDGKVIYDYMGSSEFEFGAQRQSLIRIAGIGFTQKDSVITIGEEDIPIFFIGAIGADFDGYLEYVKKFAENSLILKEPVFFHSKLKERKYPKDPLNLFDNLKAWFDIENDIIWTLSQEDSDFILQSFQQIVKSKKNVNSIFDYLFKTLK